MSTLETNVQGPHLVTQALLPLLKKSQRKLVVQMCVPDPQFILNHLLTYR